MLSRDVATINLDLNGFKGLVKGFCDRVSQCPSLDKLEEGFRLVSLGFIIVPCNRAAEVIDAQRHLTQAMQAYRSQRDRLTADQFAIAA